MLEVSTLYLLLAMLGFVLLAIIVVHHHNCSDQIRHKRNEVRSLANRLAAKNAVYEEQVTELKAQLEKLVDEIDILEQRLQP
ncbi:MAG: hypothetical protein AB7E51_03395 [Pseudodesulfovibrio sp.]|uniref:hypothetical protein n=1 Tax=Pseudodesulfovibrio sp. TaxID=2035812 RepID=UPI003D0C64D3